MNNSAILIKVQQRINKLSSKDYDNIESWMIIEAFNKAQVDWCRRQLVGTNLIKQGDEQSQRRVDDLQILLTTVPLTLLNVQIYEESAPLPVDYFEFKRLEIFATKECCKDPRLMTFYLVEEGNIINLLTDENKKPSFEWSETLVTLVGGKVRIYTNGDFDIDSAKLMYYKQPVKIQVLGAMDPYTQVVSTTDVQSILKDDVIEVLIDETVAILAGDIESLNIRAIEQQSADKNN